MNPVFLRLIDFDWVPRDELMEIGGPWAPHMLRQINAEGWNIAARRTAEGVTEYRLLGTRN